MKHIIGVTVNARGVSAVTMAAHKLKKKLNQIFIICFITLTVIPKRGNELMGTTGVAPGQRSSEETSQRWRAVGYRVSI